MLDRIILIGLGDEALSERDFAALGGAAMGAAKGAKSIHVVAEADDKDIDADQIIPDCLGHEAESL